MPGRHSTHPNDVTTASWKDSPRKPKPILNWKVVAISLIIALSVIVAAGVGTYLYLFMGNEADNKNPVEVIVLHDNDDIVDEDKVRSRRNDVADIRLVGGSHPYEGRVELLHDGTWGTICHDQWNGLDAAVACRQLGFGRNRNAWRRSYFGDGTGSIWMDNVRCDGDEDRLDQCRRRGGVNSWGNHNCDHSKDASVRCLPPNPCDDQPCMNNGRCRTLDRGRTENYFCSCVGNWEGDLCDVARCSAEVDNCQADATCTNRGNSYACVCNDGYEGNMRTCADIDECATGNNNCHADATCTNTQGSYTCSCNAGYVMYVASGTSCVDIDECSLSVETVAEGADNCHVDATCTNTQGSFTCVCNAGYTGNGTTCVDDGGATSGDGSGDLSVRSIDWNGNTNIADWVATNFNGDGSADPNDDLSSDESDDFSDDLSKYLKL